MSPTATLVVVDGYDASTYGERFAEVYDDWYGDVSDIEACTKRLAALSAAHGGGPVLELGIGSGRLALPLARLGVEVHGIDASASMVERLRAKPGGESVTVTIGDMADLALADPPSFSVVFVAFNTLFNLATDADQRRCLRRVTEVLAPGGVLVVEAFVPRDDVAAGAEASVAPRRITADEVVLTVSRVDRAAQTITGQHVHLRESGIRLRPWHLRYLTPAQLDALAADAGLELEVRSAGWRGEPFTDASEVHVSTYHRANVRPVREHPPADPR
jgi:SAM-dependent methyltransferase